VVGVQVTRHLVQPTFERTVGNVERVPVADHAVKQVLCKIFAGGRFHRQLQKKVIQGHIVPFEQFCEVTEVTVFYPLHYFFIVLLAHPFTLCVFSI